MRCMRWIFIEARPGCSTVCGGGYARSLLYSAGNTKTIPTLIVASQNHSQNAHCPDQLSSEIRCNNLPKKRARDSLISMGKSPLLTEKRGALIIRCAPYSPASSPTTSANDSPLLRRSRRAYSDAAPTWLSEAINNAIRFVSYAFFMEAGLFNNRFRSWLASRSRSSLNR